MLLLIGKTLRQISRPNGNYRSLCTIFRLTKSRNFWKATDLRKRKSAKSRRSSKHLISSTTPRQSSVWRKRKTPQNSNNTERGFQAHSIFTLYHSFRQVEIIECETVHFGMRFFGCRLLFRSSGFSRNFARPGCRAFAPDVEQCNRQGERERS